MINFIVAIFGHKMVSLINSDGDQEWYQNGQLHRDGDLPAIIRSNGDQEWHKNGELAYGYGITEMVVYQLLYV